MAVVVVGDSDGAAVGDCVGAADGATVGAPEGLADGEVVGATVVKQLEEPGKLHVPGLQGDATPLLQLEPAGQALQFFSAPPLES